MRVSSAWPEQNLLIFKEDEPAFIARAQQLAVEEASIWRWDSARYPSARALPFENKSVLIDPTGTVMVSYLKSHPVAGWEASIMKPGDGRLPVIGTKEGRMATASVSMRIFPSSFDRPDSAPRTS